MRKLLIAGLLSLSACVCYPAAAQTDMGEADGDACVGALKHLSSMAASVGSTLTKLPADQMKNILDHVRSEGSVDEAAAVKQVYVQMKEGVPRVIIWYADGDCVLGHSDPVSLQELSKALAPMHTD